MPVVYRILGQVVPSNSFVTLYQTPTSPVSRYGSRRVKRAIVSNITLSHAELFTTRYYTIRVVPSGETGGVQHEIFSGTSIAPVSTHLLTIGITLDGGDSVEIKMGDTAENVSFCAFGSEIF